MISEQGRDSCLRRIFSWMFYLYFQAVIFWAVAILWYKCESKKTGGKEGDRFLLMEKRAKSSFPRLLVSYPAATPLCGLLLWYSTSSTVQTAPFTFSTRIKHLWRDKLWRTAFYTTLLIFPNVDFFENKFDILTFCSFTWPEKYEISPKNFLEIFNCKLPYIILGGKRYNISKLCFITN